jgi:hypothetical protein
VREPEEIATPLPGRVIGKGLVKRPRTHTFARQRLGSESLYLTGLEALVRGTLSQRRAYEEL